MKVARSRIRWVPAGDGGRKTDFAGASYSTPSLWEEHRGDDEWWSLVVDLNVDPGDPTIADVRFLMSERAPEQLLHPGSKFAMFEGTQRTLEGEVIALASERPDRPVFRDPARSA